MSAAFGRHVANRAIWFALAGACLAWLLYLLGRFGDIATEAGLTSEELWGEHAIQLIYPSTYLTLASIAAFTIGGLVGRRSAITAQLVQPQSNLARPARLFATTIAIVGLALATVSAISVFVTSVSGAMVGAGPEVGHRLLTTYAPIVLYMALVVGVILIGFVFTRAPSPVASDVHRSVAELAENAAAATAAVAAAPTAATIAAATAQEAAHTQTSSPQRALAFSYTLPIISIAIALLAGLIVYDLTQQAIEAWVWWVVSALVAVGIIAGTVFAARALGAIRFETQAHAPTQPSMGAAVGGQNLNFVLSIVFVVGVAILSLNFGAQAVDSLKVKPSLSLHLDLVYLEGEDDIVKPEEDELTSDPERTRLATYGWGFERGSQVVVTYAPTNETITTDTVGRDSGFWFDIDLNPEATGLDLSTGAHDFTVAAQTVDGVTESVTLTVTVGDDGRIDLSESPFAELADTPSRIAAPTMQWVFGEFGAPLMLLVLAVVTTSITLNARNRDE